MTTAARASPGRYLTTAGREIVIPRRPGKRWPTRPGRDCVPYHHRPATGARAARGWYGWLAPDYPLEPLNG